MKKVSYAVLVPTTALALTACSESENSGAENTSAPSSSSRTGSSPPPENWDVTAPTGTAGSHATDGAPDMEMRVTVDGQTFQATTLDNETSRDFLSLLPLTLTLNDYSSTEKISDLPKRLSTEGAPDGMKPVAGDITFYAPWGNLAIFYKNFRYSNGLVKLGSIEPSGIEKFASMRGDFTVTFELADQ